MRGGTWAHTYIKFVITPHPSSFLSLSLSPSPSLPSNSTSRIPAAAPPFTRVLVPSQCPASAAGQVPAPHLYRWHASQFTTAKIIFGCCRLHWRRHSRHVRRPTSFFRCFSAATLLLTCNPPLPLLIHRSCGFNCTARLQIPPHDYCHDADLKAGRKASGAPAFRASTTSNPHLTPNREVLYLLRPRPFAGKCGASLTLNVLHCSHALRLFISCRYPSPLRSRRHPLRIPLHLHGPTRCRSTPFPSMAELQPLAPPYCPRRAITFRNRE
jgi:hypothetical protein